MELLTISAAMAASVGTAFLVQRALLQAMLRAMNPSRKRIRIS